MPGNVALDTNIVIAVFSNEKAVSREVTRANVFVSSTVLGELYYGARKSAKPAANQAKIEEFAAAVSVLSCDANTARYV
jgi:tRNA(fMet)-specific endonuclease VapC